MQLPESFFVHPDAQVSGCVVGGSLVVVIPSAIFLQMNFCLLLESRTSHNPAEVPVSMATQPWCLSNRQENKS